jgi:hypothetical protein
MVNQVGGQPISTLAFPCSMYIVAGGQPNPSAEGCSSMSVEKVTQDMFTQQ